MGGINKRKVKVFSLFLLCSFLAWFLSNLSEPYESRTEFSLHYRNLPDTLLLGTKSASSVEAKIRASGFQFLYYSFTKKRMDVDVSQVIHRNGNYILSDDALKKQLERQLSQSISLLDLYGQPVQVDLYTVASKEVEIRADIGMEFQQNYILDGRLKITPEKVVVKGPKAEIDTLTAIYTARMELKELSSDFSKDALLVFPNTLDNSIFSLSRANISGKVVKFSEKVFEVPVEVLNFPQGYKVNTFPNSINVLCKATIGRLKTIAPGDFEIVADYKQLSGSNGNTLFLEINRQPEKVYGVRLLENKINFVLEQE